MKEIDFLPQWYKASKKCQINYRRQYMIIIGTVITMIAWSLAANYSISIVQSQVEMMQRACDSNKNIAVRFREIQKQIDELSKKSKLIEQISPEVDISAVLAELSWLTDDNIVFTKLSLALEPVDDGETQKKSLNLVRKKNSSKNKSVLPAKNTRMRLIITGLAKDAANVTQLISNLENSDYFCQVIPCFSRNSKTPIGNINATEFEITCFVANYIVDREGGTK